MMEKQVILAFETSCDETAAAVYTSDQGVLSNKLFSQVAFHSQFGGVVPEIASRSHIQKINSITQEALDAAGLTLNDVDIIAVTSKPGLCANSCLEQSKKKFFIAGDAIPLYSGETITTASQDLIS